jgi:2-polyprenyl-3-methyl-5-hydroxy-6-metoxy-1,4-benzoquinol methylase
MLTTQLSVTNLNAYTDWVGALGDDYDYDFVSFKRGYELREEHISKVGFPILTKEVAHLLGKGLQGKKVIEVGCGSAYLSHNLQKLGVDITPVDTFVTSYCASGTFEKVVYTAVVKEDATQMDLSGFDVVIMSWPDYDKPFAAQITSNMKPGQVLIYQGESSYGCTGDDAFFELLFNSFEAYPLISSFINTHHVQFSGIKAIK